MPRNHGTTINGYSFDETTKDKVWEKGKIIWGVNAAIRRKDSCGAFIEYNQYGKTDENGTGWEIDHIKPASKGGTDDIENLQPLQWQNNRKKADNYPNWDCAVFAKE